MENKNFPPKELMQTEVSSDNLESADANAPVSSFSIAPRAYPIEELEVHPESGGAVYGGDGLAAMHASPFSRRKAMIVSLIITTLVVLFTGFVAAFFVKQGSRDQSANQLNVPT